MPCSGGQDNAVWSFCGTTGTLDVVLESSALRAMQRGSGGFFSLKDAAEANSSLVTVQCANRMDAVAASRGLELPLDQSAVIEVSVSGRSACAAAAGEVKGLVGGSVLACLVQLLPTVTMLVRATHPQDTVYLIILRPTVVPIGDKVPAVNYVASVRSVGRQTHHIALSPEGEVALTVPDDFSNYSAGASLLFLRFPAFTVELRDSIEVTLLISSESAKNIGGRDHKVKCASGCWRRRSGDATAAVRRGVEDVGQILSSLELLIVTESGYILVFRLDPSITAHTRCFVCTDCRKPIPRLRPRTTLASLQFASASECTPLDNFTSRWNHSDAFTEALRDCRGAASGKSMPLVSFPPSTRTRQPRLRVLASSPCRHLWFCEVNERTGRWAVEGHRWVLLSVPTSSVSRHVVQPLLFDGTMCIYDVRYVSSDTFHGFVVLVADGEAAAETQTPSVWFVTLSGIPTPAEYIPSQLTVPPSQKSLFTTSGRHWFVGVEVRSTGFSHACVQLVVQGRGGALRTTVAVPTAAEWLQLSRLATAPEAFRQALGNAVHFSVLVDAVGIGHARQDAHSRHGSGRAAEASYMPSVVTTLLETVMDEHTEGGHVYQHPGTTTVAKKVVLPSVHPSISFLLTIVGTLREWLSETQRSEDPAIAERGEAVLACCGAVSRGLYLAVASAGLRDASPSDVPPAVATLFHALLQVTGELIEELQRWGATSTGFTTLLQLVGATDGTFPSSDRTEETLWGCLAAGLFDRALPGTFSIAAHHANLLPFCSPALRDMMQTGKQLLTPQVET